MTDRTCFNCACYKEVTLSPLAPAQPQCRRNGPVPAQIRMEKPRIMDGKPVIGKDGKPIVSIETVNAYLYAPTSPTSVCFDGWRPMGIPPGSVMRTTNDDQWDTLCRRVEKPVTGTFS